MVILQVNMCQKYLVATTALSLDMILLKKQHELLDQHQKNVLCFYLLWEFHGLGLLEQPSYLNYPHTLKAQLVETKKSRNNFV